MNRLTKPSPWSNSVVQARALWPGTGITQLGGKRSAGDLPCLSFHVRFCFWHLELQGSEDMKPYGSILRTPKKMSSLTLQSPSKNGAGRVNGDDDQEISVNRRGYWTCVSAVTWTRNFWLKCFFAIDVLKVLLCVVIHWLRGVRRELKAWLLTAAVSRFRNKIYKSHLIPCNFG